MPDRKLLDLVDAEIEKLQRARDLLAGELARSARKAMPAVTRKKKKRNLSPEGRQRIIDAVKRRWAAKKKRVA